MKRVIAVTGLHRGENPQPGAGIIRSLRRRFKDLVIVGLVYDVMESGVYADDCADVVFQLPYPRVGTKALLSRLDYIRQTFAFEVLIPTLDVEMHGLLCVEDHLAERGIKLLLPTMAAYNASRKQELGKLAELCGCRTPATIPALDVKRLTEAANEIGYPLMVKGPYYGAQCVHTQAALIEQFDKIIKDWGGPVLVQRRIEGSEFDVIAVGDGNGDVGGFCSIRKTVVSEKGKGFGGIVVRDEELDRIAMDVIEQLQRRGPIELEFIKDEATNQYLLIEINPRFPAWVDFPSLVDYNLPALVVDTLLTGEMPILPPCGVGKFFIRHSVDLAGDLSQLDQLSTSGELCCTPQATVLSQLASTISLV